MRLSAHGAIGCGDDCVLASRSALLIAAIHSSSAAAVRQLGVGNAPTIPALQAAITSSGPETRNIGAANTGIRNDCASADRLSVWLAPRRRPSRFLAYSLDHHGGADPGRARRDHEAERPVGDLEGVEQRRQQDRARSPERVALGEMSAGGIDPRRSTSRSRRNMAIVTANASMNSMRSISSSVSPARASALSMAAKPAVSDARGSAPASA